MTLYIDANGDGVLNAGDSVYTTTVTDGNGNYTFTGIASGTYIVGVDTTSPALAGYTQTGDPQATGKCGDDGPFEACDSRSPVRLAPGETERVHDFGYQPPRSLGDFVWLDSNENGIQDTGEPGIAGVVITLTAPSGAFYTTTTSLETLGYYSFGSDVLTESGVYTVSVDTATLPITMAATFDNDGGLDSKTLVNVTGANFITDVIDFGYRYDGLYTITGTVFYDQGGISDALTDTFTAGDIPLEGITVYLYKVGSGIPIGSTTTDASGRYTFTNLFGGGTQYVVSVDRISAPLTDQVLTASPDGVNSYSVVTITTTNVGDQDFGYTYPFDSIIKSNDPTGEVAVGDTLTYTVVVTSQSRYQVTGGTISDTIPAGLSVQSVTLDPPGIGTTSTTPPILASNLTINPNQQITLTIVTLVDSVPPGLKMVNRASITSTRIPTPTTTPPVTNTMSLPAAIGNYVWLDENADGYQDAGEPGLANVVVVLTTSTGSVLTTTTDIQGGYIFKDLSPGTYTVTVQAASLPVGLSQTTNPILGGSDLGNQTQPYVITVAGGDENLTADFGYNWNPANITGNTGTGAIGDRVWSDADGDGFQDLSESGLSGITVTLYTDPDGDGVYDTPVATTTTAADGSYIFDGLTAGSYVIQVTPPAGYTQTGDPDHFGASTGVNDNQTTSPIALSPGDVYLNVDFGYRAPTSNDNGVGDTVYLDRNGNGSQDGGEPGIPGVSVALINDSNSNGVWDAGESIIATDVTDFIGRYFFDGLPDGNYIVWVNDTANVLGELTQTGDPDATLDNRSAVDLDSAGTSPSSVNNYIQDFGYAPAGQSSGDGLIGDTVFLDRDGDGNFDTGEGMEGIIVTLTYANGQTTTTTTDENGRYSFGNLPAGTYTVTVSPPAGLTNTVDPDAGTANESSVTIASGGIDLDQDFGYEPAGTAGSIGNLVWEDSDGDGFRDAGETGIAGVTLALYHDLDGNGQIDPGEPTVGWTTTDASGVYTFSNLATDDGGNDAAYIVDVTDQNGVLAGYWHSTVATTSDNYSKVDPYAVTLTPGASTNYTADFGYYIQPAALGDLIWYDLDQNGIQDSGEPGIARVRVTLVITYPSGAGVVTVTTTTDGQGVYTFTNLLLDENFTTDGGGTNPDYDIYVDTPFGYQFTISNVGSDDAVDSDGQIITDIFALQGTSVITYDAGLIRQNGTIGNYVWLDENGDGYQDPGEAGLPNVVVVLTTSAGSAYTTTTDALGGYSFRGLAAGTYTVTVQSSSLPSGLSQTTNPILGGYDFGNQTSPYVVTLASGDENLTADFGYNFAPPADTDTPGNNSTGAIGDRLWIDADGDGAQDTGELGLGGITVTLYTDPDGDGVYSTVAATTTTAADGSYIFDGLATGSYVVEVNGGANPAGYTQTGDPDHFGTTGANDNLTTSPIVLAPGDVFVNADFGYQPSTTANDNTIGDRVYFDADGDGSYEPNGNDGLALTSSDNEYGLPGVTVVLIEDSNGNGTWDAGEKIVATDITDATGGYLFDGVPDGNYIVWVNDTYNALSDLDQSGDPDPTFDNMSAVGVDPTGVSGSAVVNLDQDFGYTPYGDGGGDGLIGDTIFLDRDGDGSFDSGEGMAGITVTLTATTGQVYTTTTDENGHYSFGNLPAGTYTITVSPPANLNNSVDPDGGNDSQSVVTLGSGGINLDQDFGYIPTGTAGSIGNLVWNDTDGDGLRDTGEPGIGGVTVDLYRDINENGKLDPGEPLAGSTTTALDGSYSFNRLQIDDGTGSNAYYLVHVSDRDGVLAGYWHSTGSNPGSDNNSQVDPYPVILSTGSPTDLTADFGYYVEPAAIGDLVWEDLDGDGIQDPGEPGIGGVVVTLVITYPTSGISTTVTVTTTTDSNGNYSFGNLLLDEDYDGDGGSQPGYTIQVTPPAGYAGPSPIGQGGNDSLDSDGETITATPIQGQTNNTYDSGFTNNFTLVIDKSSSAGGTTSPGEVITYTIVISNPGPGTVTNVTLSDTVPAGTTYVPGSTQVTAPSNQLLGTKADDFDPGGDYTGDDSTYGSWSNDWQEINDDNNSATGQVYVDTTGCVASNCLRLDTNGAAGEGIERRADLSTAISATLTFTYTAEDNGGDSGNDRVILYLSDDGTTFTSVAVYTVENALEGQSWTASFQIGDYVNLTISTTVRFQIAGAGTHSNDRFSVDNVNIDVYGRGGTATTAGNSPTYLVASTDGYFLQAGEEMTVTYQVTVDSTLPPTITQILNTAQVTVTEIVTPLYDSTIDKLDWGTIGNYVWLDENGDGYQDAGERGLANVVVQLTNAAGTVITTTTDALGGYNFTNIPAGTYTVTVASLPYSGLAQTTLRAAGQDFGNQSQPYVVTLAAGEENMTADFGYNFGDTDNPPSGAKGAIGDRLWIDADGDGKQDSNEIGLGGITVTLYTDPDGDGIYNTVLSTTTTAADGTYIFDTLNAGSYVVEVNGGVDPADYTQTGDPDHFGATGTNDNRTTTPIILAPGDVFVNADFGYQPASAQDNTVGDTVYFDANGDGSYNGSNYGIAGVSVSLIEDTNGNGTWDSGESIIATDITDSSGNYLFDGVSDGRYVIWVNDSNHVLGALTQTGDPDATLDNMSAVDLDSGSASASGVTNLIQDFGYAPADHNSSVGLIGDTIFLNINGDSNQDAGEPGMEGITVTLTYPDSSTATTYTDENGHYYFGNLPAGIYTVTVSPPAGLTNTADPFGALDSQSVVNLTAGEIDLDQDFGYTPAASNTITGTFWLDIDANGTLAVTETTYFQGVTVALYDSNGNIIGTTTTDSNGNFSFTGLPDGTYTVKPTDEAGVLNGYWHSDGPNDNSDNNSQTDPYTIVNLNGGTTNGTADFGYYLTPAAIGDFVWYDVNRNGIQDSGEPGLSGVIVTLVITYPNNDVVNIFTTTDASGNYSFGNLLLDEDYNGFGGSEPTYSVSVGTPTGYSPTSSDQGGNDSLDSDGSGVTANPIQGATDNTYDFGFVRNTGVIGNYIWLDENGDGYQDAGEVGLANVIVQLTLPDSSVITTTTDAQGGYRFSGLAAGTYQVNVLGSSLPTGLQQTTTRAAGQDFGNQNLPYSITLADAEENLTADFGYNFVPPGDTTNPDGGTTGAIGDRVWIDVDGDGKQDPDELGLGGVTVGLYTIGDGTYNTLVATATTTADGRYIFDGLNPDVYVVRVTTPPSGYTQTGDPDHFGTTGTNDNQTTNPIILAPGDVFVNADFGYQPPSAQDNSVGDTVYFDANGDGSYGGSDYGIPGVTVALIKDTNGNGIWDSGESIIATDITDSSGNYLFDGVPDGNYIVWVNDTNNVLGELDQTGDPDAVRDNMGAVDLDAAGVFSGGVNNVDQDFGYAPVGHGSGDGLIGDFIFLDSNGDNSYDAGEPGLEGITVTLTYPGGLVLTTTTSENGYYSFGNLPAGTYTVTVTPPTSMTNSVDPDGGNDDQSVVTIGVGGINLNQDFGYKADGSANTIEGTIWEDTNADGTLTVSETNRFAGVTVILLDQNGNVVGQTTTNGSGDFSFTGLPDGTYTVKVTDDSGVLNGYWHSDGPNDNNDNNSQTDPYTVSVSGGVPNTTADFGYYVEPAALGDLIWDDLNADGIQDGGEAALGQSVVIQLTIAYPGGGTVVITQAVIGSYSFNNLLLDENYNGSAGSPTYTISIVDPPAGYLESPTTQGSDTALDSNVHAGTTATPIQGTTDNSYDFGYYEAASIGDYVWDDQDKAGDQDAGELGISGVTVLLTYSDGTTATTATDGTGYYLFDNLPPGTYTVTVQSTNQKTYDLDDGTTSPDGVAVVSVAVGEDRTDVDFGLYVPPTFVLVSDFKAYQDGGRVVVEWETSAEVGTVGFYLYRQESDGSYRQVNQEFLPAVLVPQGGIYRYVDETAQPNRPYTYQLVEVLNDGQQQPYGPFTVEASSGSGQPMTSNYSQQAHAIAQSRGKETALMVESLTAAEIVNMTGLAVVAAKIAVVEDGLYYLPAEDIAVAMGRSVTDVVSIIADNRLQLSNQGQPVDYVAVAGNVGIYFYGQEPVSLYTRENIYWLTIGPRQPEPPPPTDDRPDEILSNLLRNYHAVALAIYGNNYWFGTSNHGLIHYDATTQAVTTYTTPDLPHHLVNDLDIAPNGDVWVATNAGVAWFDGSGWQHFTTANGLPDDEVKAVAVSPSGTAWFGTAAGLSKFDGSVWTTYTEQTGLPHNQFTALAVDQAGTLWGVTANSIFGHFDGTTWVTIPDVPNNINAIAIDNGVIYLGTNKGLVKYEDGTFTSIEPQVNINDVSVDSQGRLWVIAQSGQVEAGATSPPVKVGIYDPAGSQWVVSIVDHMIYLPLIVKSGDVSAQATAPVVANQTGGTDGVTGETAGTGQTAGLSGPSPTAVQQTFTEQIHLEENNWPLTGLFQDPQTDFWLWDYVVGGYAGLDRKSFILPAHGAAASGQAVLTVYLQGATNTDVDPDHHVIIKLNGAQIGQAYWDGTDAHTVTLTVDQTALNDGNNTVEVIGMKDTGAPYSIFYIDSFDLIYQRHYHAVDNLLLAPAAGYPVVTIEGFTDPAILLFDVTDPTAPAFFTATTIDGGEGNYRISFSPASPESLYLALTPAGINSPASIRPDLTSSLKQGSNGADYLVITPLALKDVAQTLADYRQGQGLTTMVVDPEDIYDEFNDGLSSPEAIKAFLSYAYHNWYNPPRYVVLVGEGTYDYRDYQGYGGNLIPPLLVVTPHGLFASDSRLVDAEGDDGIPEMAIGRLPVLTPSELQAFIQKIIAYESGSGDWTKKVMLLADNADAAGDFPADSDAIAALIPPEYTVDKIYLPGGTRQQVLDGFNNGAGLVNYIGHGGVDRLADEGLLLSSDVLGLSNSGKTPIMTALTCVAGQFAIPGYDSLGELLATKDAGGTVAVWAPTGLSYNDEARILNQAFFQTTFGTGQPVLGEVVQQSLTVYADQGTMPYMRDIYNLLGDPALRMVK